VAHWLKAELLDSVGRTDDAYDAIMRAVKLEPTDPMFRLTRARLDVKQGRLDEGQNETQAIIDQMSLSDEVAARAHLQLGDLLGIAVKPDFQEALQHHLRAIEYATKVIEDRRFAVRRMAKRVMVDAHLSVSRDIAFGTFQRQQEVVPKWLLRATELADELISQDRGDDLLRMHIFRTTLADFAELNGEFDAALASEEALKDGKRLIAAANDPLYQQQVERLLAETLFHASKIERTRARYDSAMRFANSALALFENNVEGWQQSEHDRYFHGQLFFLVGSLYAVQSENHVEAVTWFDKALPLLASSAASPLYLLRDQGETQVSMGVSYWEVGQHEKALQLTEKGALQMKRAVEQGSLQTAALAVPYGNLAAMHEKLGNADKAKKFEEIATKLEEVSSRTLR